MFYDTGRVDQKGIPVISVAQSKHTTPPVTRKPGSSNRALIFRSTNEPDDVPNDSSSSFDDENEDGPRNTSRHEDDRYEYSDRHSPQIRRTSKHDSNNQTALKLAVGWGQRTENKWSGPRDRRFTTDEYKKHYSQAMELFEAPTSIRLKVLPLALYGDALEEYYGFNKSNSNSGRKMIRNSSALIRVLSERLETPEFIMIQKAQWADVRLSDLRKRGESD